MREGGGSERGLVAGMYGTCRGLGFFADGLVVK